jgi:hypothetical protein
MPESYHDGGDGLMFILGCAAAAIIAGAIGFALWWAGAAAETMDPARIRNLSQQTNQRYTALVQQVGDITDLQQQLEQFEVSYGADRGKWPQGKREEYDQVFTMLTNRRSAYRALCAEYQAIWADEWRGIPAPDDLPKECPLIFR